MNKWFCLFIDFNFMYVRISEVHFYLFFHRSNLTYFCLDINSKILKKSEFH